MRRTTTPARGNLSTLQWERSGTSRLSLHFCVVQILRVHSAVYKTGDSDVQTQWLSKRMTVYLSMLNSSRSCRKVNNYSCTLHPCTIAHFLCSEIFTVVVLAHMIALDPVINLWNDQLKKIQGSWKQLILYNLMDWMKCRTPYQWCEERITRI